MLSRKHFLVIFIVCLGNISLIVSTQTTLPSFEINTNLSEPNNVDGISQVEILDITQDNAGYIWIGTQDGLNRYDGYDYKIFRASKKTVNTLAHYRINELLFVKEDSLLVGTPKGLQEFDTIDQTFSSISFFQDSTVAHENPITEIFNSESNELWIAINYKGLVVYSKKSDSKIKFNKNNSALTTNQINSIVQSEDQDIWIGTQQGLYYFESGSQLKAENILRHQAFKSTAISSLAIVEDILWVGTKQGLFRLNTKDNSVSKFEKDNLGRGIPGSNIGVLLALEKFDLLVVGTRYSGLSLYDYRHNKLHSYIKNGMNGQNLKSNTVTALFSDDLNNLWIGTDEGVNIIALTGHDFGHNLSNGISNNCKNGNDIYASAIESESIIWIATFTAGLQRIDLKTGQCKIFNSKELEGIKLDDISDLQYTKENKLWISTFKQGLYVYDIPKAHLTKIKNIKDNSRIFELTETADEVIVSSYSYGTFFINKTSLTSTQLLVDGKNQPSYSLLAIDNDEYYVATRKKGLIRVSKNGKILVEYSKIFKELTHLIYDMDQDNDGNIWLATRGAGIFSLTPSNNQLKEFNIESSNLPSNIFWQVKKDNLGRMWFTGSKGLVRFDSQSNSFQLFDKKDGLQDLAYTPAADYRTDIDKMLLGGINGFNYFSPSKVHADQLNLRVSISDFELGYKPSSLLVRKTVDAIDNDVDLYLRYDQNIFSFSFSALDYSNPKRVKFAYMLKGYNDNWTETNSNKRFANFTNIAPGSYVFKVRAANKDGLWSKYESHVRIFISPPWWQTNLAYLSYLLFAIFLIYLFLKIKTKSLEKRAIILKETVRDRTHELQNEKNKVEQLLSSKNEEFANISHEFRTPLTLILGPTNQLLKNITTAEDIDRLNIIQRSGYRLLRMVDQLLNLETFKIKALTQKSPQSVGKIISLIAQAFKDLALEKNITLEIKHIENINFEFTPDALEKIILNLLSNAIKYTQKNGDISIEAIRTQDNKLEIQVNDSGIGIDESKQDLVFKRFHRILDDQSESITGAGIGLSLVKSLVEAHQGNIQLNSKLGVGTKITVVLPIIGEVDSSLVDIRGNNEIIAMEMMNLSSQPKQASAIKSEANHNIENSNNNSSNKPTILVIEDNQDMRQYIENILSENYNCLTAVNGVKGVELAQQEIPDIIVSDVMMPEMDGFEVTKTIRSEDSTSHIPIILLTARGDKQSRIRGWNEKADEYLTKPFDAQELLIRIGNLLDIRNILRKRFSENLFSNPGSGLSTGQSSEPAAEPSNNSKEIQQNVFLNKLNNILESQYHDSEFKMIQLIAQLGLSERQLYRKLKAISDLTPTEYLRRFRLEKAHIFLKSGKPASYVYLEVGFSSHSYFARCFKAQYNIPPSEYYK